MGGAATQHDDHAAAVIRAWNLMDGAIDWQALDAVAEIVGIKDTELLIAGLDVIRAFQREKAEAERRAQQQLRT